MKRIARPYANAVLNVSKSLERATRVRDELASFHDAMRQSPRLATLVTNPGVPVPARQQALAKIGQQLGFDELTQRVLGALTSRHRLGQLGEIVIGLTETINQRQGVAVAEVRTAEQLGDDERAQLQRVLEQKIGKKLQLRETVDASLLAGFVARVDSQLYDGSLRGQLERLARELAEVEVGA